jgi:hypothetical protein
MNYLSYCIDFCTKNHFLYLYYSIKNLMWASGASTTSSSTLKLQARHTLPDWFSRPTRPALAPCPMGPTASTRATLSQQLPCGPQRPCRQLIRLPNTRPHLRSYHNTQKNSVERALKPTPLCSRNLELTIRTHVP